MPVEEKQPRNLYDLMPQRLVQFEKDEKDRVTLLVPKFRKGFMARWLQPRLRRPAFRIKLDDYGSFVWLRCDGKTDVRTIGEQMKSQWGEDAEPIFDRIERFLQQLEHSEFIKFADQPDVKG